MRYTVDNEDRDTYDTPDCEYCAGPTLTMGPLGRRIWYRCTNCHHEQDQNGDDL